MKSSRSNRYLIWGMVGGILVLALALRLWGIDFGLPHIYHYDERFYVGKAVRMGVGQLHSAPYGPMAYVNILLVEYVVYYAIGRLAGLFASTQAFEALYRSDPTTFYLLGRVTSALFGTATVALVYWLGRILSGRMTGLLAALFLATSYLHVRDSHYAVPDITTTFFVVLAVLLAVKAVRSSRFKWIKWGALAGGAAISAKWTALPVCLPLWWAAAHVDVRPGHRLWRRLVSSKVLWAGALVIVGFAITGFQVFHRPSLYIDEALAQQGAGQEGGFEIWLVDSVPGWLFYLKTLALGAGAPLLALGLIGMVRTTVASIRKREILGLVCILFPLAYGAFMGSTRHYFARYSLLFIPFLALFAADLVVAIARAAQDRLRVHPAGAGAALTGLAIAVILGGMTALPPLAAVARHNWLLNQTDTRTTARLWIEENIPAGSRIAVDWAVHTPPLRSTEDALSDDAIVYDVEAIGGAGLSKHSLSWYRDQGFEYLITTSYINQIPLVYPDQDQERRAFYDSLSHQAQLIQVFHPWDDPDMMPFVFDEIYGPIVALWQRRVPGPTLRIYHLE